MTNDQAHITLYDKEYATCQHTHVSLCIYPVDLSPDQITSLLAISPTTARVKGEKSAPNSAGRIRTHPRTNWILSSEGFVQSKDLRDHLDWLTSIVMPAKDRLLELQKRPGAKMTVYCSWWASDLGGPTLWPKQMAALAELNLEIGFLSGFEPDDQDR